MDYPEVIDEAPMHINAQALHKVCARYGDDADALETVALAIATYANPRGKAFPGVSLLARLTGYAAKEVSRLTHILQAAGVFIIRTVKAKGAPHAHNVYYFAKNFIHRTANITSAHFIGNLKNWKAKASDVAAAVVDHAQQAARAALDSLSEKAAKMAAVFQEKPELMETPELAAQAAGIVGMEPISEPGEWEDVSAVAPVTWEEAVPPTVGGITVAPTASEPTQPEPTIAPRVYASWRDRVAAYRKDTVTA